MLTRPEIESKQLLVLAVEPGKDSKIKLKNKNIIYEKDGQIVNQCSLTRILHLMIAGDISLTTNLIREINSNGVSASLLKTNLTPYAYFGFETQANFILRSKQYELTNNQNLIIAKSIIDDKINNQAILLNRIGSSDELVRMYQADILNITSPKVLLGVEGSASKAFFCDYYELYGWVRRCPRIKEDPINFLLDIGYTVLFNFVDAICRHFGLDTYKGVYHTQFFARRSLVCDLMEPFRCLVDSRTRTALGLGIFKAEMFKTGKYGVYTEWKDTSVITKAYAQEVIDNRQVIFAYVQGFYKYLMEQHNEMPHFKLKR